MDNITLNIGGKTIPLRFRMSEFIEIEEEVGYAGELKQMILKGKNRLRNMITTIRILGNGGLKHAGETPDLTDEWLRENMDPHALLAYQAAIIACMMRDGRSEAQEQQNENKERDLVLEEIEAKKDPVNLHTGE